MIDTIITLIGYLATFAIIYVILYKANEIANFHFHLKRYRGFRFVTVPAYLTFRVGTEESDDVELSDPLLNKLMGKDAKKDEEKFKYVNINYTLDLEQVKTYHEYTYDDGKSDTVQLNCTYVWFLDRTYVVLNLTYNDFDDIMNKYNNEMYNLV